MSAPWPTPGAGLPIFRQSHSKGAKARSPRPPGATAIDEAGPTCRVESEVRPLTETSPLLEIRFRGSAVGPGTMPLAELLRFLTGMREALRRVAYVLQGHSNSLRQGRTPSSVESEIDLDLVSFGQGSSVAVFGFDRKTRRESIAGFDSGIDIIQKSVAGLRVIQESSSSAPFPSGYDVGVLKAWNNAGGGFSQGIEEIHIIMNQDGQTVQASFTSDGNDRIKRRIESITEKQETFEVIEGTLLMADFAKDVGSCRVHPSIGSPVQCEFDDTKADSVLQNLKNKVRITGILRRASDSGSGKRVEMDSIEPLIEKIERRSEPSHPTTKNDLRTSPTIDELARQQNVSPIADIRSLYGTWPGEPDDGFEELIEELRHGKTIAYDD